MLIPNYDRGEHFTHIIHKSVREQFPELAFYILNRGETRLVKWETNTGWHSHTVQVLDKEDVFELLNKIKETE